MENHTTKKRVADVQQNDRNTTTDFKFSPRRNRARGMKSKTENSYSNQQKI